MVLEINGNMGFDLRAWVSRSLLMSVYYHERWFMKRLAIGYINYYTMNGYAPHATLYIMAKALYNTFKCRDWEKLFTIL